MLSRVILSVAVAYAAYVIALAVIALVDAFFQQLSTQGLLIAPVFFALPIVFATWQAMRCHR